jgi:hypothetical protein
MTDKLIVPARIIYMLKKGNRARGAAYRQGYRASQDPASRARMLDPHGQITKETEYTMKKLLTVTAMLVALIATAATTAQAKDLPACDGETVLKTFIKVSNAVHTDPEMGGVKLKDIEPTANVNKRWCHAAYTRNFCPDRYCPVGSIRSTESIFTLEWINESLDRFWLQIVR